MFHFWRRYWRHCLGFKYWADPTALSHEALDVLNAFVLAPCRIEGDEIAGITAG
jgi:amino acid permease